MIRVTLKGLLGRKLRLALTSLAIVMGVGMVSGTYVLSDTINSSLRSLFSVVYANSDAIVTGKAVFGGNGEAPSFPDSTLGTDRAAPRRRGRRRRRRGAGGDRRRRREGRLTRQRIAARPEHRSAATSVSASSGSPRAAGRRARARSRSTPRRPAPSTYRVGDRVGMIINGGREQHVQGHRHRELRGLDLARRRHALDLRPPDRAEAVRPAGQARPDRRRGEAGRADRDAARPRSGRCCRRTRRCAPARQQAQSEYNDYDSAITTLRYFLLAFGGIALFVGAFVIANTLSITVAQRTREFATLRTLGATARQVRCDGDRSRGS